MKMEEIQGAVARGWGSSKNEKKVMDVDLATAISVEVKKLFVANKEPKLGCATTRQLLAEIKARIEIDGKLDYRTIEEVVPQAQEAKARADSEGIDSAYETACADEQQVEPKT